MGKKNPLLILITEDGRRIGLIVAWHFLNQKQPVIISYRTHYSAIDGLREVGAICIPADSSTDEGVLAFADEVKVQTDGLYAIVHNASAWVAEKPGALFSEVSSRMIQAHVNTLYLPDHALEGLLYGHGHAANDIIHFTDYVVKRDSDKHIAYAASKAALDNMTRPFARKLVPEVRVNVTAPSFILFSEGDDAEYHQQALSKSLMKTVPGEREVINLADYLLTSYFVTRHDSVLDDGRHLR